MNQQFYAPTSSYYGQQQATTTTITCQTNQSSQSYAVGEASTSGAGQTSQTSISDMLAAASERVLERCGLEYDETAGMYYDANSALYYDQVCIRPPSFFTLSSLVNFILFKPLLYFHSYMLATCMNKDGAGCLKHFSSIKSHLIADKSVYLELLMHNIGRGSP